MTIRKAVITAAGRAQRSIPLQTLIAQDGVQKSVLAILAEEVQNVRELTSMSRSRPSGSKLLMS